MSTRPYIESNAVAALASLGSALDREGDMTHDVQRHVLVAYEQVRAIQEIIETERRLIEIAKRADAFVAVPPKAPKVARCK